MRPTVSTSRTDSARTAATRRRMSSPTSWPSRGVGRPEVVDVEDRQRHLAALPAGPGQLELEDAGDGALVGEPGQRVGVGHPLEPLGALRRPWRPAGPGRRRWPPGSPGPRGRAVGSSSACGAGQPKPIAPSTVSTPPKLTSSGQVGTDERSARAAVASRSKPAVRPVAASWNGCPGSWASSASVDAVGQPVTRPGSGRAGPGRSGRWRRCSRRGARRRRRDRRRGRHRGRRPGRGRDRRGQAGCGGRGTDRRWSRVDSCTRVTGEGFGARIVHRRESPRADRVDPRRCRHRYSAR